MSASLPRRPALLLRLCGGVALAWMAGTALATPGFAPLARAATVLVAGLTLWSPASGLVATIALAPAGLLMAPAPARVAELLVWAFLAAWLLTAWRRPAAPRARGDTLLPAALYALCAGASWLAYTLGGSAGLRPLLVPAGIARALHPDHLVFSSPEPETFTVLPLLAGLGLFASAAVVTREHPRARHAVAAAVAASAALLGVLTIGDVLRQWATMGYGGWFLLRYVEGSRFSLHLQDLNAAGSHFVLGGLVAVGLALADRTRRPLWIALALLVTPALWISGSRSASLGGLIVGCGVIPLVRRRASIRVRPAHLAILLILLAGAAVGGAVLASAPGDQGTASNALRLRSQFLVTSARMFASAPIFGVGIGHYHERSNEFMPAALREVYRHENAHNYFAQQFAELGFVGGVLFVWLVVSVLWAGWLHVRNGAGTDAAALGLLAGTAGYILTCVTGHPLLVPEVALPFWGAFGALAGTAPHASSATKRWIVAAVALLAAANVATEARRYALTTSPPGERGFYEVEKTNDGTTFVWMTRHGVFYIGPQSGTLLVPVRAPDLPRRPEPFTLTVAVGGKPAAVHDVSPDRWTTIEIPLRERASMPFRRVDLYANRSWTRMKDLGGREDDAPRSVMVGETRWIPAGGR